MTPASSSAGAAAETRAATRIASSRERVPSRPIPVSSLTWSRTGADGGDDEDDDENPSNRETKRSSQATTSARAPSATASSASLLAPTTRDGAPIPPGGRLAA